MTYSPNKGKYRVKNPSKYRGDPTTVIYRSTWELKLMNYLDTNPDVIWWNSEEVVIPYVSPIDGKWHRYFPDFLVCTMGLNGEERISLIEVKPSRETKAPSVRKRATKKYIQEVATWGRNAAKWDAAYNYCKKKNWHFTIITEKDLNIKQ